MRDPVVTNSGNSYEREEIQKIIAKGGDEPMT
jgi:hypothetical protein